METTIKYEEIDDMEQTNSNKYQQNETTQQTEKLPTVAAAAAAAAATNKSMGYNNEMTYEDHHQGTSTTAITTSAAHFTNATNTMTTQQQQQQQQQQLQQLQQFQHSNLLHDIHSQHFRNPKCRFIRGDSNLLFGPPFFSLEHNYNALARGDTLSARCHTCKVPIRGHKNVSSNFIKHLKRMHPKIYVLYENYKLQRMHGIVRQQPASIGADLNQHQHHQHHNHTLDNQQQQQQQNDAAAAVAAAAYINQHEQPQPQQHYSNDMLTSDNNAGEDYMKANQILQDTAAVVAAAAAAAAVSRNNTADDTTSASASDYYDNDHLQCVETELSESNDCTRNNDDVSPIFPTIHQVATTAAAAYSAEDTDSAKIQNNDKNKTLSMDMLESLIGRILDEKLQRDNKVVVSSCTKPHIERSILSPASPASTSSISDIASVDLSLKSEYSQHVELQAQLNSVQHELRQINRNQRYIQRQLIDMRKMLRRRTLVLDIGKLKKRTT